MSEFEIESRDIMNQCRAVGFPAEQIESIGRELVRLSTVTAWTRVELLRIAGSHLRNGDTFDELMAHIRRLE